MEFKNKKQRKYLNFQVMDKYYVCIPAVKYIDIFLSIIRRNIIH